MFEITREKKQSEVNGGQIKIKKIKNEDLHLWRSLEMPTTDRWPMQCLFL